ncbi:MAG: radical SAM protein [Bacillota bacterium]
MREYKGYEKILQEQLQEFLTIDNPIVIFGASIMGICAKKAVDFLGKKAVCFCDNDKNKQGIIVEGLSVLSPEEVKAQYPNARIYICLSNIENINQVNKQLISLGFTNTRNKDMLYYIYQLKVIKRPISSHDLANTIDVLNNRNDKLTIYMVGVVVTEKCSLNCKDCSLLIPYYKNPKNYDKDVIIKSMKTLSESVDAIEALTLLGGESLLHPDVLEICEEASKLKNVERIHILTNGTIVPSKESLERLRPSLTYMIINDYGKMSDKKEKLKNACYDCNIECHVYPETESWYPVKMPEKHDRSSDEKANIFALCTWGRQCMELQNGKFHICGYSASGTELGVIHSTDQDYVNLVDGELTIPQIRAKLDNLLNHVSYITACDYCGIDFNGTVNRALQK